MYPHERSLVTRLAGKPFALIGINSDPRERLKSAMERENITWRSFWDGGTSNGPIAQAYHVTNWPTIYVIDHKGKIRHVGEGIRGSRVEWLEPVVKKLLAEAEPEIESTVQTSAGHATQ